ncbi:hypothetical protein P154DRAFT_559189 [Amniculicola lignicola CBS 123094]|uniref:Lytic polysaccharide monooxygenase n=1 Tax=Amniculicola lignicola CBS 123094 TaxID=1392246 RepID=A0A6A5X1D7_9PLEO|nr:hypothetical protein P154DRAFT_559189 [Amniculicola lignicola CBS 123094]
MRFYFAVATLAALARAAELTMEGQNVTAGEEVQIIIANATEAGSGYPGKTVTDLKIGIFNTIYNFWMCSLTDFIPAVDGPMKVTVPPEMGPSGTYYEIASLGYENPGEFGFTDFIIRMGNTKLFFLSGGKGKWTPAETMPDLKYNGLTNFLEADIPCSSYPCAQDCAKKQFPSADVWYYQSVWIECLKACDGVKADWPTGTGSFTNPTPVAVPESLPETKEECKEEDFRTKCGEECCSRYEYCSGYKVCVELPLDVESLRSKWSATRSPTSVASQTGTTVVTGGAGQTGSGTATGGETKSTGAASGREVDWKVLGAMAGAFGVGVLEQL